MWWKIRLAALVLILPSPLSAAPMDLPYRRLDSFPATLLALRAAVASAPGISSEKLAQWHEGIGEDFPVQTDWVMQDGGGEMAAWLVAKAGTEIEQRMIGRALAELGEYSASLRRELDQLRREKASSQDARWLNLYVRAGEQRRARRLAAVRAGAPRIVFTKRIDGIGIISDEMRRHASPAWNWIGRVPPEKGRELIRRARAVVYFSEYEGFGMPPVEAALEGTCPVYSDIPPICEVMAGTGQPFSNSSADEFAAAMNRALATRAEEVAGWAEQLLARHNWPAVIHRIIAGLRDAEPAVD